MIRHALTELSPEEYERLHKFFPGPNQGTMATRNPLWTPSRGPVDGRLIAGDAFGAPSHPEVLHPEQCRESNYRAKHSTVESARVGEPQGRFRTAARLGHKRNVPLPGRDDPRQRLGMPGTCRRGLIRRAMSLPILVGFWLCRLLLMLYRHPILGDPPPNPLGQLERIPRPLLRRHLTEPVLKRSADVDLLSLLPEFGLPAREPGQLNCTTAARNRATARDDQSPARRAIACHETARRRRALPRRASPGMAVAADAAPRSRQ